MLRRYKNKPMMLDKAPHLLKEWDFSKNKKLDPKLITYGSFRKIFWRCSKDPDHRWSTNVYHRVVKKTGCPYCKNLLPSKTNNLKVLFPKIASEWDRSKNNKNPENFLAKSNKYAWWKCKNNHSFRSKISNRVLLKRNCPYCFGRYPSKENNLLIKFPEKAKLFDIKKNKITPDKVSPNSGKKYWWRCDKNHSYYQVCNWVFDTRQKKSTGCPYCKGYKVGKDNNLAFLYPDLCKEWDFKKNKPLTPKKVTAGTDKAVWWKCKKNHSWKANINSRVYGNNCSLCQKKTTSFAEIRLFSELIRIFPNIIRKDRTYKIEKDLFLPSLKIAIEFDGSYWHSKKLDLDKKKFNKLKRKGIFLIRVREKPLKKTGKNDIVVNSHQLIKSDINLLLKKLIKFTNPNTKKIVYEYLKSKSFLNNNFYNKLISNFPGPIYQDSFEYRYPNLVKLWDKKKNKNLSPKLFSYASNVKVWWRCKNNHSWYGPFNRVRKAILNPCKICAIAERKKKGWFKSTKNKKFNGLSVDSVGGVF